MTYFTTRYVAKEPDQTGHVNYSPEQNKIWHDLFVRQIQLIQTRACSEYLRGLDILKMTANHIPQLNEMNQALKNTTAWGVHAVPALIPADYFFELLSKRLFPAATFIRSLEDFDYVTEPDIFHEFFGHCPMLTEPTYAEFMYEYGKLGLKASDTEREYLARLYWFTVEFGLIQTKDGLKIYGGGILSSKSETIYAVESPTPLRIPFDLITVLRTSFRIDILQPIYFVIEDYNILYELMSLDLKAYIQKAIDMGDLPPHYPTP